MAKVPVYKGAENKSYYKYYSEMQIAPLDLGRRQYIENIKVEKEDVLSIHDRLKFQQGNCLPKKTGIYRPKEGGALVASNVPVKNITPEKMAWWAAWHGLDPLRYALWDCDDHYDVWVNEEGKKRILDPNVPVAEKMWGITHRVVESLGDSKPDNIEMNFLNPADAGYDPALIGTDVCPFMVCANSKMNGKIPVFMTEILTKVDDGYEMRIRFWVGYQVENGKGVLKIPKFIRIPTKVLKALVGHNFKEFAHLDKILPAIYEEEKDNWTV